MYTYVNVEYRNTSRLMNKQGRVFVYEAGISIKGKMIKIKLKYIILFIVS